LISSQFPDGGHDVTSRRNVLQPGNSKRSVFPATMQQRRQVFHSFIGDWARSVCAMVCVCTSSFTRTKGVEQI